MSPNQESLIRSTIRLGLLASTLIWGAIGPAYLSAQSYRGGDPSRLFGFASRKNQSSTTSPSATQDHSSGRVNPQDEGRSAEEGDEIDPDEDEMDAEEDADEPSNRLFGPLIPESTGISIEPIYYGEVFTNARGGISTNNATRYEALLDIGITLDFEQMRSPLPGRFFMLVQQSSGRGLSEDFVGDFQVVSNIDTGDNIMQVSEYWWEIPMRDDKLLFRLGKQDLNTEFLVTEIAGDFIQSSFGISPTLAVPTFPHPSAAAVLLAQVTEATQLKFGLWDGFPDGRNWGFSGSGSVLVVGELQHGWAFCDDRFPGAFDIGIGHQNSGTEPSGAPIGSGTGFYFQCEQIVYRENCCDQEDEQGLGVFAQFAVINGEQQSGDLDGFNAGLVYQGLFNGRDDDLFGLGVATVHSLFGGTNREIATEIFYKAQIRPWMTLQPDVQYISSPSGIHRDALVIGTRFEIAW